MSDRVGKGSDFAKNETFPKAQGRQGVGFCKKRNFSQSPFYTVLFYICFVLCYNIFEKSVATFNGLRDLVKNIS